MHRILVIEDDSTEQSDLVDILNQNQFQVECVESITQALDDVPLASFDLIITDLRVNGQAGTDIIPLAHDTPVLVMASFASLRSAVEAMKLGAVDYVAKPFDSADLLSTIHDILAKQSENKRAPNRSTDQQASDLIYGRCQPMRKVFSLIEKVAPTTASVLIQGETGSGKELAAKAIHKMSHRRNQEIVCINCAAIPESLIESELFGHEKGAFTGAGSARAGLIEAADGGTLFLDEIGELPLDAQARLLRVLQEGEIRRVGSISSKKVDVRLIAATHRNLKSLSRTGQFREDLYYRLNVVQIRLPPLRERGKDITGLAHLLLERARERLARPTVELSTDALRAIQEYNWPGNVRELENAIERGVILCDHDLINAELLDIEALPSEVSLTQGLVRGNAMQTVSSSPVQIGKPLSMEDYFQQFVLENQSKMNETELAKHLGISRKSLWEKRNKLGIPRKKSDEPH
ncbi:Fis family transcriptional regulator [Oleiphilus sp. HI0009]|nr:MULTISPECIES: sigma-54 dependent transcriptional regulator [unclassified Oleiphilus]KZX74203.1 Fis family transcriptional regulator [Oleiphilus sp. HI0009]KZY65894.1 Fis family transcriptional regulator [Oleiphilus sp. HI0066]KZY70898.1 Fis family transcriptional regulator [Oleiphilus sp. HI0067]MCH2158152.1 sigma-54 dependent transcriptional regulator [Oleiphilaceae bacterium]